jgi:hypothetical protein
VSTNDLISPGTRGRFREIATDHYLGEIDAAFHDEGFAPNPDCAYQDSSERRTRAQEYLTAVDWTDPAHVKRALGAIERITETHDPEHLDKLRRALFRDGYDLDAAGAITPRNPDPVSVGPLSGLRDPAAITDNLERIRRAVDSDPALVIGSAKELIESTAKTVLSELGLPVYEKDDVPDLIRQAQQALHLHPSSVTPGPDGSDAIKKIPRLGHRSRDRRRRAAQPRLRHRTRRQRRPAPRAPPTPRPTRHQRCDHLVPARARHPRRHQGTMARPQPEPLRCKNLPKTGPHCPA